MTHQARPKQTCADCVFFHQSEIGECHHDAPVIIALPDAGQYRTAWPAVPRSAWCGRWQFNPETLDQPDWHSLNVESQPFSVRALNCLDNANIRTFGDLAKWTGDELLTVRHLGTTTLLEIKQRFRNVTGSDLDTEALKHAAATASKQGTPMDDYTAEDRSH